MLRLKRFDQLLSELSAHPHFESLNWQALDARLTNELRRFAGNHLVTTAAGIPRDRIRKVYFSENDKEAARALLREAVKRGTIVKPVQCEGCGWTGSSHLLHGHHTDYSKPYNVVWLCIDCHSDEHSLSSAKTVFVKKRRRNQRLSSKRERGAFAGKPC